MAKKSAAEPKKRPGYTTRSGKKPLMLNLTPDEHAKIKAAAASIGSRGKPMTQFVLDHALAAAEKQLEKSAKKS